MPNQYWEPTYNPTPAPMGAGSRRRQRNVAPLPELEPIEQPEQDGLFEKYGPTGIRALGVLLGLTPLRGAGASAVTEGIAQGVEQAYGNRDGFDLSEIGTAGILGGLGGGMAGSIAKSLGGGGSLSKGAVAAAPWAVAQPLAESVLRDPEGDGIDIDDPLGVATKAAVGIGTGALAGKLGQFLGAPGLGKAPKAVDETFEVIPTARKGGTTFAPDGKSTIGVGSVAPIKAKGGVAGLVDEGVHPGQDTRGAVAYPQHEDAASGLTSPSVQRSITNETRATEKAARTEASAAREAERQAKIAAQAEKDAIASEHLTAARESGEYVPKDSITETYRAPVAGGTETLTRRWLPAEADDAAEGGGNLVSGLARTARASEIDEGVEALAKVLGPTGHITPEELVAQGIPADMAQEMAQRLSTRGAAQTATQPLAAASDVATGATVAPQGAINPFQEAADAVTREMGTAGLPGPPPATLADDILDEFHTEQVMNRPVGAGVGTGAPEVEALREGAQSPPGFREKIDAIFATMGQPKQPTEPLISPESLTRTRADVSGEHYRNLKNLLKTGDVPPTQAGAVKEGYKTAGQALRREGAEQSPEAKAAFEAGQPAPPTAPAAPAKPFNLEEELAKADAAKGRPGGSIWNNLSSERGQAAIMPLARIGMGGIGAAIGGATDPLGDPFMSVLAGGAAGAFAPTLIKKLGELGPIATQDASVSVTADSVLQHLGSPEGVRNIITQAVNTAPEIMRSNMLINPNFAANFLAPYSSAYIRAVEAHLTGDPRGKILMELLSNPKNYLDELPNAWSEAKMLIGEAERSGGKMLGHAGGPIETYAAAPGTALTASDVAIRNLGKRAGFSNDEMRNFTFTNEPETATGRAIVNVKRGMPAPVGNFLAPFLKTLVNVNEQGIRRIPGIGSIAQMLRPADKIDPIKTQILQQAMGAGAGAIGFGAGYAAPDDPFWNRLLAGGVTNLSGPTALLAGAGFVGGQAAQRGDDAIDVGFKMLQTPLTEMPMPSVGLPSQYLNATENLLRGNPSLPAGMIPGRGFLQMDSLRDLLGMEEANAINQPRAQQSPRRRAKARRRQREE